GAWRLRGSRLAMAAPLLVLALLNLAFALLAMNPADAVRYALPTLLAVAFLAAVGIAVVTAGVRAPWLLVPAAVVLAAGFVVYTWPLLRERTTAPSPPVQALTWARAHLPPGARLLVDPPLAPHASELLGDRDLRLPAPALAAAGGAGRRPLWLLADGASGWPGAVAF